MWRHLAVIASQSTGHRRFPISVPYTPLVLLLPFASYYRFSAQYYQTGSGNGSYGAPHSGTITIDRWAAFGFLLVFHTLHSSNCSRLRVIIDFKPRKIKPEVETSLCDATHRNTYIGTIQAAIGFLIESYTMRSCNSCRFRVIPIFSFLSQTGSGNGLTWRHEAAST